ncbi:SCO7613 C-terminal domain-containing membrane protein [Streptomyces sp. DT24]|uniref:SCO7613 C-terminal domain-containing membrane protein n=1 Tax=Streptomyces sp. DT24 TaxID=3416520 RepID=UPI003CE92CE8
MEHVPPPAEELTLLDRELVRLDARRAQLLTRRVWLLTVLQPPGTPGTPHPGPYAAPAADPGWGAAPGWGATAPGWGAPARTAPKGALSPRGAQHVLLVLGGLLLTIAAIAFTVVSWGRMGIGGRAAVLGVLTVAALAAPVPLLRRKLPSTAEALAALALVLTALDAYAWYRVAAPGTGGLGFAAGASAVLAVLWAGYGLLLPALRVPLPAAVVGAQFPFLFWAAATDASALGIGWALVLTATLDGMIAIRCGRPAMRATAVTVGCVTGFVGLLTGLAASLTAQSAAAAVSPGVLLLVAAGGLLLVACRAPREFGTAGGAAAGLAVVAAVGGVVRPEVPAGWWVAVYLLCGAAVAAAARGPLPRPVRRGARASVAAVAAGAALWAAPAAGVVLLGPLSRVGDAWAGAPSGAREALGTTLLWPHWIAVPVVLAVLSGLCAAAHRWSLRPDGTDAPEAVAPGTAGPSVSVPRRVTARRTAGVCVVVSGWGALLTLPAALDVPYPVAWAAQTLWVGALLAVGVRGCRGRVANPAVTVTALVCAGVGAVSAGALSLASEPATYAVFGALAALAVTGAVRAPGGAVRAVLGCAAVMCAIVVARAAGESLGLAGHRAAPIVLIVPALTVLLGARLRRDPMAAPVEAAGALGALVALGTAVTDASALSLVLGLCGVLAAGTAVRPERRAVAGWPAVALLAIAVWVRLAASGVSAPEAYTLPLTLPALAAGALLRRRDRGASSWKAYGGGLAVTLVPSLGAVWADPHWTRPLLLGAAALVITLAGARFRLQALLVLGGAALALDGLHELAPYVVQVAGVLPRWVPPALAGVLLLAVGATYEHRLRDARRLRDAVVRMR